MKTFILWILVIIAMTMAKDCRTNNRCKKAGGVCTEVCDGTEVDRPCQKGCICCKPPSPLEVRLEKIEEQLDTILMNQGDQVELFYCEYGGPPKCVPPDLGTPSGCPPNMPIRVANGWCPWIMICCEDGCLFGGKEYRPGQIIEETCLSLQCLENGTWSYLERIRPDCGHCTGYGEPHFIEFNQYHYDFMEVGTFLISQLQFPSESIGVDSEFDGTCGMNVSCIKSVTYRETGIKVTMTIVQFNGADGEITVDVGSNMNVHIGNSVKSFYDGKVLVFEGTPTYLLKCMNIVGNKGYSVTLCTRDYSYMMVFAMPSLLNKINGTGKCGVYTKTGQDDDIIRNRDVVQGIDQNEIDDFRNGWAEQNHHNRIKRDNNVGWCTSSSWLAQFNSACLDVTKIACDVMSNEWCDAINAACVFDLCRVENPTNYYHGYASHMQVYPQIANVEYCQCHYNAQLGGCKITIAAPADTACKCYEVTSIFGGKLYTYCYGVVVGCELPSSPYCNDPDTSYCSCFLGGGNCKGYPGAHTPTGGQCECHFIEMREGCTITKQAPKDTACLCWAEAKGYGHNSGGPFCLSKVIGCNDPSSQYCKDPSTSYDSCLQGCGNCGGYPRYITPPQ